ncbi:MAG: CopD family protein [Candidatus Odinarchaeia archaeon]
MANIIVFGLVNSLHILFTVIWIGGLILLGLILTPSIKKTLGMKEDSKELIFTIQRKLSIFVYISIIGLIFTGILLTNSSAAFEGFFNLASPYSLLLSVKIVFVAIMIIIALYRSLVLGRNPNIMDNSPENEGKRKLYKALLLINIVLGVAVIFLSGFSAALAAMPVPTP